MPTPGYQVSTMPHIENLNKEPVKNNP